jgi:type IV pilus assembly protein PilW
MRVQYGRDTTSPNMDGIMDQFDQTLPATACDLARISAIRIALVARNIQHGPVVTSAAPLWAGSTVVAATTANPIANPTAVPIDLSNNPDWAHYRYKVFQTIVPLKNMIWMGLPC